MGVRYVYTNFINASYMKNIMTIREKQKSDIIFKWKRSTLEKSIDTVACSIVCSTE